MARLAIVMLIGGGVLAFLGGRELMVSCQCSSEPVQTDLAELEKGGEIDNPHVKIGDHVAVLSSTIYVSTGDKIPTDKTKVSEVYYAIVSPDHHATKVLKPIEEQFQNGKMLTENDIPTLNDFAVLVKTKRYKTYGEIPAGIATDRKEISGLVINQLESLEEDEKKLIKDSFRKVDFDKLLIIEEGRTPGTMKNVGMLVGGIALAIFGLALLVIGAKNS